jgi:phosphoserine phosphatase RsbU/P
MHELADQYTSALKNLLAGREQDSLHRAYELGQQAVENGLGMLDIAAVYREALGLALQQIPEAGACALKATDFFIKNLAPLEATWQAEIAGYKRVEEALRESEARFRQVAEMAGEWIWEQDPSGHYIYSSSAVKDILGYAPEEILGKSYYELFTPEDREHWTSEIPYVAGIKEPFFHLINHYIHKDGHEVFTESNGAPILDPQGKLIKWRGVDRDFTERKRFEDALRLRDRAIVASRVGMIITDPSQPDDPIIYANPAFLQITGYTEEELLGRNPRLLQGPDTDPHVLEEIRKALCEQRDCHITLQNYRKDGTPFWNELLISPVRDERGKLTHFMGVQMDVTKLRRAEQARHEMEIAKQIQLSLLPCEPLQVEGALITGYCLPAAHVGGDYFDYFGVQDTVDIVIADVSGHSVGAALIMAETRAALRIGIRQLRGSALANSAAETLSALNDLLYEDLTRAELFVTMFYMKYHAANSELRYANAGHNRPLLLRHGACTELDAEGLVLGVDKGAVFEEKRLFLEKGDAVLLYTDGITEAQDKDGRLFGPARLSDLFAGHAETPPQGIIEGIIKELESFCQSRAFNDDISLVVLKIT